LGGAQVEGERGIEKKAERRERWRYNLRREKAQFFLPSTLWGGLVAKLGSVGGKRDTWKQ